MTSPEDHHNMNEWLLLAFLILFGGTSFSGIRIAVETLEPAIVSAGRLWVAAIMLGAYALATGRQFPPFFRTGSKSIAPDPRWTYMILLGLIGYAIPFFLFPWAQQVLPSMLAGIYMAFMPLMTVVMARFFAGETLGPRKLTGFLIGTAGVITLIGPEAVSNLGTGNVLAQSGLLAAVTCYAIYAVLTRRAPPMQARIFAAGTVLAAAILVTPAALLAGQDWSDISARSVLAVFYLGIFPSGINAIIIILIIRKAGAGFMSMSNYATPVVAILAGLLMFAEPLKPGFVAGLSIILTGLAISQSRQIATVGRGIMNLPAVQKQIRPRK